MLLTIMGCQGSGNEPREMGGLPDASIVLPDGNEQGGQDGVSLQDVLPRTLDPLEICVNTINDYRATIGRVPYERWLTAEPCVAGQAAEWAQTRIPHGAYGRCGEAGQNQCPGRAGTVEAVLAGCLAGFWAEQPGGHYLLLATSTFRRAACGFSVDAGDLVWWTVDFQ